MDTDRKYYPDVFLLVSIHYYHAGSLNIYVIAHNSQSKDGMLKMEREKSR